MWQKRRLPVLHKHCASPLQLPHHRPLLHLLEGQCPPPRESSRDLVLSGQDLCVLLAICWRRPHAKEACTCEIGGTTVHVTQVREVQDAHVKLLNFCAIEGAFRL